MAITAAISALAGTAYAAKQGNDARREAQRATQAAETRAAAQADKADQAVNRANKKTPDIGALLTANEAGAQGGAGSTLLTGIGGVDPNELKLGKTTLLGS